jgi:hypothetical protein
MRQRVRGCPELDGMAVVTAEVSGSVRGRTDQVAMRGRTRASQPHSYEPLTCGSRRPEYRVRMRTARGAMSALATAGLTTRPRSWPACARRPDTCPGCRAADTSLAVGRAPSVWAAVVRKQRTVNPPTDPTRYNFLYYPSRPALRAAARGGRPRPAGQFGNVPLPACQP